MPLLVCQADSFEDIKAAGWWIRNMYHAEIEYTDHYPIDPNNPEGEWGPVKKKVPGVVVHVQNYMDGKDPDVGWRQGKPVPELIEQAKETTKVRRIVSAEHCTISETFNSIREKIGLPVRCYCEMPTHPECSPEHCGCPVEKTVDEHGK